MGLEHLVVKAAADKAEQDFHGNCKKDRNGNPYVVGNSLFRGFCYVFLPLGLTVLTICIVAPSFYVMEGIDPANIPLFMYCISIFLVTVTWRFLRTKATLKRDELVIRGTFTRRCISLDELRMSALSRRPKITGPGLVSFATDTKDARVLFLNSTGGKDFVKTLCNRIHAPLPEGFSNYR